MNTRDAEKIARRIVWGQYDQWIGSSSSGLLVDQDALAQLIVDELKELEPKTSGKKPKPEPGKLKCLRCNAGAEWIGKEKHR